MAKRGRALLGRWMLAGLMGLPAGLTACQAPAAPVAAPARRPVAPAPAADDPLPLQRAPGVALLRGAQAPAPVPISVRVAADGPAGARVEGVDVAAATGGVVLSPDGRLRAVFPPGALDRDARVALERLPTDDLPAGPGTIPAMRFRLDLGGARVAPDQAIQVTDVLDPGVAARVAATLPAERLAAYGFSREAGGALAMTMPVRGPATREAAPVAAPVPPAGWFAREFGGLPLPDVDRPAARRLLAAGGTPVRVPAEMPRTIAAFWALEKAGVFGCDMTMLCFFIQLQGQFFGTREAPLDPAACGLAFGVPPAAAPPAPPAADERPPAAAIAPGRVRVRVVWASDDPALDGRPVPGAIVRFRLPGGPGAGPDEVVADALGVAGTTAPAGAQGFPQAVAPDGRRAGEARAVTVQDGGTELTLAIPRAAPVVMLHVRSDQALPGRVRVRFALGDGPPQDREVAVPTAGAPDALLPLAIALPPGTAGAVPFSLLAVDLGDGRAPEQLTGSFGIAHDGVYPASAIFGAPPPK